MNQKLMTVDQLAEFLQVSTETIRRYIRSGKLKCLKVGHQSRFTSAQINEFLNADVVSAEPETNDDLVNDYD